MVPTGWVTALEIDPVLIERAERYLRGRGEGRWRMVQASIMDTGLPAALIAPATLIPLAPDPYLQCELPSQACYQVETRVE